MPGFTAYEYVVTELTAMSPLNGPTVSYQVQRNFKRIR
jgi:hypothetical protein